MKEYVNASDIIACENIHFYFLVAAGDVSRGGTSANKRQKFHTDDVNHYYVNIDLCHQYGISVTES